MLELGKNARTILVPESCSTSSGCSWPNPTHTTIVSSSPEEVGPNGVPSPWVATSLQIQFAVLVLSPRVGSISAKAFTVDMADMLVEERSFGPTYAGWRIGPGM